MPALKGLEQYAGGLVSIDILSLWDRIIRVVSGLFGFPVCFVSIDVSVLPDLIVFMFWVAIVMPSLKGLEQYVG